MKLNEVKRRPGKINGLARRSFLLAASAVAAAIAAPFRLSAQDGGMPRRKIPISGEEIPIVGLGTSDEFNRVPSDGLDPLKAVLRALLDQGGTLVDTAPIYGNSENILGEIFADMGITESLFVATKVRTSGRQSGLDQMARSVQMLGKEPLDLLQVHSLSDVDTQLENLKAWKAEGKVRYIGVTVSRSTQYRELERVMRQQDLDFVQMNYSVVETDVEKMLLPMAQDRGMAVLVNRPFGNGRYFSRVGRMALPDWVTDFDCESWAQFTLKYALAHPAVTAVIPATSDPEHAVDNFRAGLGRFPDEATRARMREFIQQI
jgi:aryl-alcohol dehydrogenase-like predicted oxidoreductase